MGWLGGGWAEAARGHAAPDPRLILPAYYLTCFSNRTARTADVPPAHHDQHGRQGGAHRQVGGDERPGLPAGESTFTRAGGPTDARNSNLTMGLFHKHGAHGPVGGGRAVDVQPDHQPCHHQEERLRQGGMACCPESVAHAQLISQMGLPSHAKPPPSLSLVSRLFGLAAPCQQHSHSLPFPPLIPFLLTCLAYSLLLTCF